MKRILIIVAGLWFATPIYAYGMKNDIETFMNVIMVVNIIWGILCLILFFKIWGMTNDVKQLKQKICGGAYQSNSLKDTIHKLHLLGKDDEACDAINSQFVLSVNNLVEEIKRASYLPSGVEKTADANYKPSDFYAHGKPVEEYFKEKMSEIYEELNPLYKAIGCEKPSQFSTLTLTDLLNFGK